MKQKSLMTRIYLIAALSFSLIPIKVNSVYEDLNENLEITSSSIILYTIRLGSNNHGCSRG